MPIPDYQSIMLPLLRLAGDSKEHRFRDAVEKLATEFQITDAERAELLPSGTNEFGKHVSVQVKASRGTSWQFGDITCFCEISFKGKRQIIGKLKQCPVQRLIVIFVKIDAAGSDQYYILTWQRLRDIVVKNHQVYLAHHNGMRPQRWDSLHGAVTEKSLRAYKDRWQTVEKSLR